MTEDASIAPARSAAVNSSAHSILSPLTILPIPDGGPSASRRSWKDASYAVVYVSAKDVVLTF
ncbi:hypothetical protein FIBSPDRAFT_1051080 [Athelia psychrophila]|uniref:Uncharacterized protein n=1 Tax=Athelia psychrophila TaxID=1759441 RepID=A0A165ZRS0_9AGAM|nr:hypothetical protein FIBSPDRAFT_1051080 [Fibularhizoctonia sp. CBS 109695]